MAVYIPADEMMPKLAESILAVPRTMLLLITGVMLLLMVVYLVSQEKVQRFSLQRVANFLRFCYGCFLKPHEKGSRDQKLALESFYKAQASIYDSTRTALLKGREDMLGLVAAQLQWRVKTGVIPRKPIWVDVGGGTGYNIEQMARFVDVPNFFDKVFLVDLSPSLTAIAIDRFIRLGWANVEVICQDARNFRLEEHYGASQSVNTSSSPVTRRPDLLTMSYALSMIPNYFSVVDSLATKLAENGVIGVVDFYVQNEVEYYARNYIGGDFNRHCMWISRVFWRAWFEADRVNLDPARRDYLEYRFGTILSFNDRCRLLGLRIPYYVWIGCSKSDGVSRPRLDQLNAQATESPFISALDLHSRSLQESHEASAREIRSKGYESAVVNLTASIPLPASWYQQHHWRLYYDDALSKHRQFGNEYIYAFTWEDAREDVRLLDIKDDDVMLAITSAGDNILAYALQHPKRIHAVDLNPNQNHLLELKLAAFTELGHSDVWALFGQGKHSTFRELLINRLSPHLSSLAFQYWLHHGPYAFSEDGHGLYHTGGSRHALNLVRWLAHIFGLKCAVQQLCEAKTLEEQRSIWKKKLRPVLLSRWLSRIILSNKTWLWRALGVPQPQREMIEQDHVYCLATESNEDASTVLECEGVWASSPDGKAPLAVSGGAIWNYCVRTLDPVAMSSHLRTSNHYYLLTLLGHYTRESHPDYLGVQAHATLSAPGAFDGLRIHTDELREVLSRLQPGTLTIAVVMDSFDWFEHGRRAGQQGAAAQVRLLRQALVEGGRVLVRSAGLRPWYVAVFEAHGFDTRRVALRKEATCVDRVNMYASTWICTKRPHSPVLMRTSTGSGSEPSIELRLAEGEGKPALEALSIGDPTLRVE